MDSRFLEMLIQLESEGLEVALMPAPEPRHSGHMVRVAVSKNPAWYRRLCEKFPSSRRDNPRGKRTRIKRAHIVSLLERMIEGERPESVYTAELEALAP